MFSLIKLLTCTNIDVFSATLNNIAGANAILPIKKPCLGEVFCLHFNGQFRLQSPLPGSIGKSSIFTEYHRRPKDSNLKLKKCRDTMVDLMNPHCKNTSQISSCFQPKHLAYCVKLLEVVMKLTFDTCHMLCRSSVCSAAASLAFKDASLGKNAGWYHMVDGLKI